MKPSKNIRFTTNIINTGWFHNHTHGSILRSCQRICPNPADTSSSTDNNMKHKWCSLLHHLLQITNESPQVYFYVVEHTQLLRAVLASAFFTDLGFKDRLKCLQCR